MADTSRTNGEREVELPPESADFFALTGAKQAWLDMCAARWTKGPDAVSELLAPGSPYTDALRLGGGQDRGRHGSDPLADEKESVALPAARAIMAVAQALADPARVATVIPEALSHWGRAHFLPLADGPVEVPEEMIGHSPPAARSVLQRLHEDLPRDGELHSGPETGFAALLALRLSNSLPRPTCTVRTPVLFDRAALGGTGTLQLSLLPFGPPGLYPHPSHMSFLATDEAFQAALTTAWRRSDLADESRCVLWSLLDRDDPCNDARQGSLAAAFGVALDELRRRRTKFGRYRLRRLDPRCAVTGGLGEGDRLLAVRGYENKLAAAAAAEPRLRVVVPDASRSESLESLVRDSGVRVDYAERLNDAIGHTRTQINRRLVAATSVVLTVLLSLGGATAVLGNRATAAEENARRIEIAQRLSSTALDMIDSDLDLAQLLAVEAYRTYPDAQARATLFQSVTANPALVKYLWTDQAVSALATPMDGGVVVAGTEGGQLWSWPLDSDVRTDVGRLPSAVTDIATSAVGDTILATDGSTAMLRDALGRARELDTSELQQVSAVAVSPSGRYATIFGPTDVIDPNLGSLHKLLLFDNTGRLVESTTTEHRGDELAMPSDSAVLIATRGEGWWDRRNLPSLERELHSNASLTGVHSQAAAVSANGEHYAFTNGAAVRIWSTRESAVFGAEADTTIEIGSGTADSLAISDDGSQVAVASGGTISVQSAEGAAQRPPLVLQGATGTTVPRLLFAGPNGLLSASENFVIYWDLGEPSRIGQRREIALRWACNACPSPEIAVHPSNHAVAVVNGDQSAVTIADFDPLGDQTIVGDPEFNFDTHYYSPVWSPDGSQLFIGSSDGLAIVDPADGTVLTGGWSGEVVGAPLGFSSDGLSLVTADGTGIHFTGISDGQQERAVPTELGPAPTGWAAAPGSTMVGIIDGLVPHLVDTEIGNITQVPLNDAVELAFTDSELLIQRQDGTLEVWDPADVGPLRALPGNGYTDTFAANRQSTLVVRQRTDGVFVLFDLVTGEAVGTLPIVVDQRPGSTGIAFSPDGASLISASEANNGVLGNWALSVPAWIAAACTAAGRELTPPKSGLAARAHLRLRTSHATARSTKSGGRDRDGGVSDAEPAAAGLRGFYAAHDWRQRLAAARTVLGHWC